MHVFTDGSGGTETKDPHLRRCGYGVAWVLANCGTLNTLGKTQSVARAELLAAVVAHQLCAKATQQVIIWSDCMFVLHGFARGRRRKHLSHADPWKDFWIAHDAIGPRVSLYKVWKGRVTEAEIAAGLISPLEADGSDVADKLAERGAIRNAVSLEFVAGIRQTDLCVKLVQTRLIEANLLHDQNKPKFARAAADSPVRRGKFDPAHAIVLDTIFAEYRLGKGDTPSSVAVVSSVVTNHS